jgi:adenosylcobyric acid synthase
MDWLQERTGVPTVAIIPMLRHALPEEDAFHHRAGLLPGQINIALLLYPYASNLDEFDPLIYTPGVNVVPVRARQSLAGYDAIILPGSKNTAQSLRYLRREGLDREVRRVAAAGRPVMGVCGGMQLLGARLLDPHGLESGDIEGLGLLDLTTTLAPHKVTRQRTVVWQGETLRGYEIHHGRTTAGGGTEKYLPEGLGWRQNHIYGVYLHGLFENASYRRWFLAQLGWQGEATDWAAVVEAELNRVSHLVEESGWAGKISMVNGGNFCNSSLLTARSSHKPLSIHH